MNAKVTQELVLGFGYINGIWLALGVEPETAIIQFIVEYIRGIPYEWKLILFSIPVILTLISVIRTYRLGGMIGAIAVGLAFFAGSIIFKNIVVSVFVLLNALMIGALGFRKK